MKLEIFNAQETQAIFVYLENIRQNPKNPKNPKNPNLRIDLAMMVIDDFRRSPQLWSGFWVFGFFWFFGLGVEPPGDRELFRNFQ